MRPAVLAAVARIGGPHDLRLRTTVRHDACVWTTYLPTYPMYETTFRGSDAVQQTLIEEDVLPDLDVITYDRAEAEAAHDAMVATVTAHLCS